MEEEFAWWQTHTVIRVYLLVEGQTEEGFVRELLVPHYARMGLYLSPIIIRTSPRHKGGVVRFAQVRPQIERLCKQDALAHVTTMFDLYALPSDFPGKNNAEFLSLTRGKDKANYLEKQLEETINESNFIPYLMVHEFEALLFTQPERFGDWAEKEVVETLSTVRHTSQPEDINDDPATTPSKRILSVMPNYQKSMHGPLIAMDIGLDAMRVHCPHFNNWLTQLEAL